MEVMWTCSSTSQAQVLPSECSFVALDGRNIMSSFFKRTKIITYVLLFA